MHGRKVYDCIMYNGEVDVLLIRLHELEPVVDTIVIVEADTTFSGLPRQLAFDINDPRICAFAHSIRHVVVRDMPDTTDPWKREAWQRNAVLRGISDARKDDVIVMSDADEIPRATAIRQLVEKAENRAYGLGLTLSYFFLNYCVVAGPDSLSPWTIAAPRSVIDQTTPDALRNGVRRGTIDAEIIRDAGWHFSYLFDLDGVKRKIGQFSHQEFNNSSFLDAIDIQAIVRDKRDLFGQRGNVWDIVDPVTLPLWVKKNPGSFENFILRRQIDTTN